MDAPTDRPTAQDDVADDGVALMLEAEHRDGVVHAGLDDVAVGGIEAGGVRQRLLVAGTSLWVCVNSTYMFVL